MMRKKFQLFPKNMGFFPYIWLIYLVLPIISTSNETGIKLIIGYALIALFAVSYRQLFVAWNQFNSFWLGLQMLIIVVMCTFYDPFNLYMGFFTANFIGQYTEQRKFNLAMIVFAMVELLPLAYSLSHLSFSDLLFTLPFFIIMLMSPFAVRSMNRHKQLGKKLDQANEQIKELVKREERMRIARDLHDTLGHTLSLITLKSQLIEKLVVKDSQRAQYEAEEIQRISRTALRQMRELVSDMRAVTIAEELIETKEILQSADIVLTVDGDAQFNGVPDLTQNILSLCLKEAVNNIVKHSQAENCRIAVSTSEADVRISIEDDGVGLLCDDFGDSNRGNGLKGMAERLSLIEGSLTLFPGKIKGTILLVRVPLIIKERKDGESI